MLTLLTTHGNPQDSAFDPAKAEASAGRLLTCSTMAFCF
jgi:hypothetical protein